jgi:hypothetical protein
MRKVLFVWLILLFGCANPGPPPAAEDGPVATPRQVPPTFTPFVPLIPEPSPATPIAPEATAGAGSPTPSFDETVVELRYTIPALGLDRRLEGTVASKITVVDETTGASQEHSNQAAILLQLQQSLSDLELAPPPDGCQTCVRLEYSLPLSSVTASGWLQDPILLASVENYMAVMLGPHFPPATAVGLRRSASPFAPAHTVALTADGRLWRWLATDEQVADPVDADPALPALLGEVAAAELEAEYVVGCTGSPVETLFLNASEAPRQIFIVCPEFALPASLLPLYLQLNAALTPILAEVSLARPPSALPLSALLDYRRADGARLTLYQDGAAIAIDTDDEVYTGTLAMTQVMSLTTGLLDSGQLQPGLSTFTGAAGETAPPATSVLRLRGPAGVYDGRWQNVAAIAALDEVNALLDSLVGRAPGEPEEPEPAEATIPAALLTGTPAATAPATATATPTVTATASP